ncbi:MAG: CoA-binding protein [Syntrophorhabdus sp.]
MNNLRTMLDPRTIALIGATDREDSIGFAVLKNLLKSSDRSLYPVNPGKSDILGIPCFPSIRDVPSPVDLCVIVTPASTVPAIVDECGQAGVAGVIILSAGFSESGPKGRVLEDKVNETRKK